GRSGPMSRSATAFARGARTGVRIVRLTAAVPTARAPRASGPLEGRREILRAAGARRLVCFLDDLDHVPRLLARRTHRAVLEHRLDQVHDVGVDVRLLDRQVVAALVRLVGEGEALLARAAHGLVLEA